MPIVKQVSAFTDWHEMRTHSNKMLSDSWNLINFMSKLLAWCKQTVLCYDQQTCSRQHAVWWSNHSTSSAVMGKSQSHLGFKSRFEHIWRFDFNNKDSTQKITILLRFDWNLWFIWKKRLKAWQISCLFTDVKRNAQITETLLLQMMLKLHCTNWLMLQVLWLYEIYHVWLGLK